MSKDSLGDRMKDDYENRTRYELPRRSYTLIRCDGKAFHSFTEGCKRPFDDRLIEAMNKTAVHLCSEITGTRLGYVQSDEISILLTDFESPKTQAWFDGNLQKIVSISASLATAAFNHYYKKDAEEFNPALFDARAWTISIPVEVENYFIFRQQDAIRNSVNMVAQSLYSHRELLGVQIEETLNLIQKKGQNWNDYDLGKKNGRAIIRRSYQIPHPKTPQEQVTRHRWEVVEPPVFTEDRSFLRSLIPKLPEFSSGTD